MAERENKVISLEWKRFTFNTGKVVIGTALFYSVSDSSLSSLHKNLVCLVFTMAYIFAHGKELLSLSTGIFTVFLVKA